jgi:putative ABC transport system permease protein
MFDYIEEILSTLKKNKLRAVMTGFSVAWGIFMLIILLGSGNGLQNGMEFNFRNIAKNAIQIWPGRTSENFEGLGKGRQVQFTNEDYDLMKRELSGIDDITGRLYLWSDVAITYGSEYANYTVTCVMPEFINIRLMDVVKGRFINHMDIKENRKVITLSQSIVDMLFKEVEPIGEYVKVGGIYFQVVGVLDNPTDKNSKDAIIPVSTGQRVFNGANRLSNLALTTTSTSVEVNKQIEEEIKEFLAKRHRFSTTDDEALYVWNTLEDFKQAQGVFSGIRLFIWIIGIMTIIAGIVGVSNIMIILVKERTKEIGIRKAIGATPWSVILLVLSESLFITAVAGLVGMLFGMGLLHIASSVLTGIAETNDTIRFIFYNPSANFGVAISATILLVVAGLLAGFIPARKAAGIKPIEALHDE